MRTKQHRKDSAKRNESQRSPSPSASRSSESASQTGWLTKPQLAKALRVCTKTIETWVRERRIPAYKIGRRTIRFRLDECEAALRAYRTETVTK